MSAIGAVAGRVTTLGRVIMLNTCNNTDCVGGGDIGLAGTVLR